MNMGMAALEHAEKMLRTSERNASMKDEKKGKSELRKEVEKLRERNAKLEREVRNLKRQVDQPDYSYFGYGDGPT